MSSPTTEQVAAVIDQAIRTQGFSVNKMAALSLIPRQTLERKLAGAAPFNIPELTRLALVLGTSTSALLAEAEGVAA